jgi:phage gp29-like protein
MICRGLLIPSLLFDEGLRTGSYALGASHFDAFYLSVRALYRQLAETLIEQFVRRLVEYNFGPREDGYGEFQERPPDPEQMKVLAEGFRLLVDAGVLSPGNAEDQRWMRSRLGLPEPAVSEGLAEDLEAYPRYFRGE